MSIISKDFKISEFKPLTDNERIQQLERAKKLIMDSAVRIFSPAASLSATSVILGFLVQKITEYVASSNEIGHFFDWIRFRKEKFDAQLASELNTHSHLIHVMSKAAKVFEKIKSNHLNVKEHDFRREITSANVNAFADSVIQSLR